MAEFAWSQIAALRLRHEDGWYDWAAATLSPPQPEVLVHADFHGDDQV